MMRICRAMWAGVVMVVVGGALGGCMCPCAKPPLEVTPQVPLTLTEQVGVLDMRARAIPLLAARGNAKVSWTDEKGRHNEQADASLRILQRYDAEAVKNGGGNVVLFGRIAGQEVFQAGRNPQQFWFLVRLDVKTAWVGQSGEATPDAAAMRGVAQAPFQVDDLIDLLGITQAGILDGQTVVQRYNQSKTAPEVDVLVLAKAGGTSNTRYIQRAITIDRVTGNVVRVALYDVNGMPMVTSELSDYRDAPYREGDKYRADVLPQRMPHHVTIHYAKNDATAEFSFDEVTIPSKIPPAAFETPNFAEEGLKVVPIN